MKYKLIKLLPFENSPRIGYTSEPHLSQKDEDHYWNGLWFNPENYPEFWQPVVEKNYEILELSLQRSIKHQIVSALENSEDYTISLLSCNGNKIHSVKRLSDGKEEIFTIGDKTTLGIITCFRLLDNEIMVDFDNRNSILLKSTQLQHIKEPIFQTEDGVDIFEGDTIYEIFPTFTIYETKWYNYYGKNGKPLKNKIYFSTKEKAEEYILMNKPCLSLKEIKETTTIKGLSLKKLEKLVKSKIQQSV